MKIISIILGKIILKLCKMRGRGSSFPGSFTYKINHNILSCFERPKLVVAATGSSGKGSTTKLIAEVLRKENYKVAYNDKGSNELSAIITTFLENCTITGKTKVDAAVFEMDERYAKFVFKKVKPDYVIITNITRDQPPRQRNYDFIFNEIYNSIDPSMHLILNADDPYLQKFNLDNKFKVTYYGIDKTKNSYEKNKFSNLNIVYCPKCLTKLNYEYYHFETLGHFSCPNCGLKTKDKLFAITKDLGNKIIINNKYKVSLNNDMLFNKYNVLAALTALSLCGINEEKACEIINNKKDEKIYNQVKLGNRNVYIMNNKNENATTFNESILYTTKDKKLKTIVIGWWQISRRYDFDDLSWLYDIEFELLKNQNIDKIIAAGPQRYDIAVRLKFAGIDPKKIIIKEDLYTAKNNILKSKGDIYAILNFDYIKPFNEILEENL